ncbi:unnamed protein product [Mytilus coruscus]|uniref:HECT domain-containing protein n=1 Tax=Mytilus coruscus TaxID=42192 RepID=A0A6J8DI33_MYTCO|nr:unnamed protein product [Mytilus coruscus]
MKACKLKHDLLMSLLNFQHLQHLTHQICQISHQRNSTLSQPGTSGASTTVTSERSNSSSTQITSTLSSPGRNRATVALEGSNTPSPRRGRVISSPVARRSNSTPCRTGLSSNSGRQRRRTAITADDFIHAVLLKLPIPNQQEETKPYHLPGQNECTENFEKKIKEHKELFIHNDSDDPLLMEVKRGNPVQDSLAFISISQDDLHSPLWLSFTDEDGVDLGGLRWEFWSLFLHKITSSVFVTGKPGRQTLRENFVARTQNIFYHLGQLVALSISQDGPGLPIFSDIVTDYILLGKPCILNVDDLPEGLKNTIVMILQVALLETQLNKCKKELDQFIKGLDTHHVLSLLKQDVNIACARTLFSGRVNPLTVQTLRNLLRFKYDTGNAALGQRATGQGFLTFLQATKGEYLELNQFIDVQHV